MERTKESFLLKSFVIVIAFLLLAVNISNVYANVTIKKGSLPDFVEAFLQYQAA